MKLVKNNPALATGSSPSPRLGERAGVRGILLLSAFLFFSISAFAAPYYLRFTPPLPADTNGSLSGYQGAWQYTNATGSATNTWFFFAQVPTNSVKLTINNTVGSPAYLIVRSLGTNGLLSTNLTRVLYDTNALVLTLTNNPPVIPTGPTVFVVTNN